MLRYEKNLDFVTTISVQWLRCTTIEMKLVNWYKKGEILVFGSTIGAILYINFGVALIMGWYNSTTHLIDTKEKYLYRKERQTF